MDALRAQMIANAKTAQPISEAASKSSAPASMVLLPDGVLDFSDELSNDGEDLLDEDPNELKLKRPTETNRDLAGTTEPKTEVDGGRAKLRIKTGGDYEYFDFHLTILVIEKFFFRNQLVGKTIQR